MKAIKHVICHHPITLKQVDVDEHLVLWCAHCACEVTRAETDATGPIAMVFE